MEKDAAADIRTAEPLEPLRSRKKFDDLLQVLPFGLVDAGDVLEETRPCASSQKLGPDLPKHDPYCRRRPASGGKRKIQTAEDGDERQSVTSSVRSQLLPSGRRLGRVIDTFFVEARHQVDHSAHRSRRRRLS